MSIRTDVWLILISSRQLRVRLGYDFLTVCVYILPYHSHACNRILTCFPITISVLLDKHSPYPLKSNTYIEQTENSLENPIRPPKSTIGHLRSSTRSTQSRNLPLVIIVSCPQYPHHVHLYYRLAIIYSHKSQMGGR